MANDNTNTTETINSDQSQTTQSDGADTTGLSEAEEQRITNRAEEIAEEKGLDDSDRVSLADTRTDRTGLQRERTSIPKARLRAINELGLTKDWRAEQFGAGYNEPGEATTQAQENASDTTAGDPDTVAGAGADEALQAGADPESLSGMGPISESEGEQIADRIDGPQPDQTGSTRISDPSDLADVDDNRRIRERVASELPGTSADEVDIVATGSGYEAVGPGGETVTSLGSGGGVPGRQPTDATYSGQGRSVGDRSTGAGATAGLEAARRQVREEVAGQSDRLDERDVRTEVVDGRVEGSVSDEARRQISDPTEVEGQSERVIENRGEVRASVNRYGQRQLGQQAISTGNTDPTPGTTPGVADRVLTADADPEIARDLTDSGGLFAEEGDRGTPITNATGVSEEDLREPSDPVLPGVLPSRQQLREGGAGDTRLFASNAEDPAGTVPDREGVGERALEGAAVAGASILNVRERAADAEQIVEGVQALPREVREEGAGDVGETLTALGRREGVETAARFESEPVRSTSGLALDLAGGAVAVGRIPDTRDLKAEVDPRIGMFGETIESRALGLRSRDSDVGGGVDVDQSQTVGDQVSRLPTERPTGLTADTVDEARGVSGPSRTSRVRGELERGIDRVRNRVQTERERFSVDTRVGSGLGGLEVRRETDTTPDSPSDFSPSRDEILSGSPRDQISSDIVDRQRAARQQFGGDYEGAPSPFDTDRATYDPTADADSRRRAAERRFTEQSDTPDLDGETRRSFAPDSRGGVAGGLLAGAFGRADAAQQSRVTTGGAFGDADTVGRVDVDTGVDTVGDVRGGVDLDQGVDTRIDQDTRLDVGQDIRQDLDTRQDIDTPFDPDLRDPLDPTRDPPTRDPPTDPPTRDPPTEFPPPELDTDDSPEFDSQFGFDGEEFENRIATPTQFLF